MWTREFWKATAERSIKTFGETLAAVATAAGTGLIRLVLNDITGTD